MGCGHGDSRFPQDAITKDQWISATGKRNWFPTSNSRICSLHFTESDYNNSTKRRTLLKNAVPTVNTWKLITEVTNNDDDAEIKSEPGSPVSSSICSSPSCFQKCTILQAILTDKQKISMAEYEKTVTGTPRERKLRAEVDQQKRVIKEQRMKIKRLQCKARRYKKTILKLKELNKNLEDKRFINEDQTSVSEGMNVGT
ncbi:THAP domain-containing protein 1-like isoform X2 [Trichoplusia ni]|uniref:THAP domain-containing protein 1-like isoform X2 n=1 Tax=Trichoplusia ni TaxID=7111 RepID=A0A7E5VZ85_TRINI|nr:THAP domain-containing protein 1-like isoform X2 [Trichoplusia ni]